MLKVGALLQQRQRRAWRLPCLGGRSVVKRRQKAFVSTMETDFFKGKSVKWNQGFRCSCKAIDNALIRRSNGPALVAVMENFDSEKRSTEALKLKSLEVDEPILKRSLSLNSKINKASKWVVVGLVGAGVLWRHDDHAVWFCVGSAASGVFCKLLKYLINENRPPTADGVKGDPGMPSSHAQGFFCIGSYTSLAWSLVAGLLWQGINVWSSISAFGILLSCAYLSWLRVREGLHTVPQVLVGASLGTAAGAFWLYLWKAGVESAMHSSFIAKFILYMSFAAACAASYITHSKHWELGQP